MCVRRGEPRRLLLSDEARSIEQGAGARYGDVRGVLLHHRARREQGTGGGRQGSRIEVPGGIVIMRYGENALDVIDGVKARLAEIQRTLPEGVQIVVTYDRSELIRGSIATLKHTLIEEMVGDLAGLPAPLQRQRRRVDRNDRARRPRRRDRRRHAALPDAGASRLEDRGSAAHA
jgi:hypothetical protein